MTRQPDAPDDGDEGPATEATTEDVYREMDPFEPYTTGELAALLSIPRRLARSLLDALTAEEQVRKKEPEAGRAIWIRDPPRHECDGCGHTFEIRYVHPVFQAVQFCPRCGEQL